MADTSKEESKRSCARNGKCQHGRSWPALFLQVDEMVNTFSELNRGMEATGTFTMKRKKLFQLVAAANTTLADVILRLGLLERYC